MGITACNIHHRDDKDSISKSHYAGIDSTIRQGINISSVVCAMTSNRRKTSQADSSYNKKPVLLIKPSKLYHFRNAYRRGISEPERKKYLEK